ncbi:MAG TPA: TetR family transcriptional regulator [Streptosporangiaceae bacterium]|nr:TetR family transcriptional regulator [Streptosporangiaceae bacterium]
MAPTQAREADKTRLTKQAVVDCALALGDAEGVEALTIRRIATELGVTPMALYWHFRNKEELLAGVGDQIWRELDTDVDLSAPWDRQLRGLLESLLHVLRSHPCASQLILEGEKQSDAALLASETALAVLHRGGFDPDHAAEITRTALFTGLMLIMSEPGSKQGMSAAEKAEAQRKQHVRLALLPPGQYPCLVEAALPMSTCDPEFHYRFGVDLFVAGVKALAAEH